MDKQDYIDEFFKQYGKNKFKEKNNHCAKNKKVCPYTKSGKCKGVCYV